MAWVPPISSERGSSSSRLDLGLITFYFLKGLSVVFLHSRFRSFYLFQRSLSDSVSVLSIFFWLRIFQVFVFFLWPHLIPFSQLSVPDFVCEKIGTQKNGGTKTSKNVKYPAQYPRFGGHPSQKREGETAKNLILRGDERERRVGRGRGGYNFFWPHVIPFSQLSVPTF